MIHGRLEPDTSVSSRSTSPDGLSQHRLEVDLGRISAITQVRLSFPAATLWSFVVEASLDGAAWVGLLDRRAGQPGRIFAESCTGVYRHVRLTVFNPEHGDRASDTELAVFGADASGNPAATEARELAAGVSVTSSSHRLGFAAKRAVNGGSGHWQAADATYPQWLALDLGNVCRVDDIEMTFPHVGAWSFAVDGSVDAGSWETLWEGQTDGARRAALSVDHAVRHLRLRVLGGSDEGASCERFAVNGIGSPRTTRWWQDRSGVRRHYVKYYGTALTEVTAGLDELKARGYTAVELMAPYAGPPDVWAGLGATDNYDIDPSIGTLGDFDRLIAEAHRRDMRVIFFGNVGYARKVAPFYVKAEDDQRKGVDSRERRWFHFSDVPHSERWYWSNRAQAFYYAFWGDSIPSYNFAHEEWIEESRRYVAFWMDRGLDGFAVDAPDVYDGITPERNHAAITDALDDYDTLTNPEGARDLAFVPEWHYNTLQDYTLVDWGGDGFSAIQDAIREANPSQLRKLLAGHRDRVVEAGGVTITPPSWEIEDVTAEQRLLEIAVLTTLGTIFTLHSGRHTLQPELTVIPTWSLEQQALIDQLVTVQNAYRALSPGGRRIELRTNDDDRYWAYLRTDASAAVRALVVINFTDAPTTVSVDLRDTDLAGPRIPLQLLTGQPAEGIVGETYEVTLPALGFTILAL